MACLCGGTGGRGKRKENNDEYTGSAGTRTVGTRRPLGRFHSTEADVPEKPCESEGRGSRFSRNPSLQPCCSSRACSHHRVHSHAPSVRAGRGPLPAGKKRGRRSGEEELNTRGPSRFSPGTHLGYFGGSQGATRPGCLPLLPCRLGLGKGFRWRREVKDRASASPLGRSRTHDGGVGTSASEWTTVSSMAMDVVAAEAPEILKSSQVDLVLSAPPSLSLVG